MLKTDDIPDVPDVSAEWYRDVVDWAHGTPSVVQAFMEHFTDLGVVLLAALWLVAFWRARRGPARPMAVALVGGAGAVVAYAVNELAKGVLSAERPCRALADVVIIADECPPTGDWSFPSNHAAVAGALAVVVLLTSRRLGLLSLPAAALVAFSRVFVGVHYPHDVVVGILIGSFVAAAIVLLFRIPATRAVALLRERSTLRRWLMADPTPANLPVGRDRKPATPH